MAARTRKQLPVGSLQWIQDENQQISQFEIQEAEDFAFSARNEVEWLNEHMADIFSKNQINVTEVFKTPGKLRGKTPRTARKRNALEVRQPLTDVFSTNKILNSNIPPKGFPGEFGGVHFALSPKISEKKTDIRKPNTDSGYHGMSEDEMEVDEAVATIQLQSATQDTVNRSSPNISIRAPQQAEVHSERQRTTEGSFHSAEEDLLKAELPIAAPGSPVNAGVLPIVENTRLPQLPTSAPEALDEPIDLEGTDESVLGKNSNANISHSPSEGSSPVKPLVRKSSLTFAALPAREPLATKRSLGARASTTHPDQPKPVVNRGSFLGRFTGGKSLGGVRQLDHLDNGCNDDMDIDQNENLEMHQEDSDGDVKITKLHNKSSTQRLHEKISLLGKSQPARPTKSTSTAQANSQPIYPELPTVDSQTTILRATLVKDMSTATTKVDNDDEDWIQPPLAHKNSSRLSHPMEPLSADGMDAGQSEKDISDIQPDASKSKEEGSEEISQVYHYTMVDRKHGDVTRLDLVSKPAPKDSAANKEMSQETTVEPFESIKESNLPVTQNSEAPTTPLGTPSSKRYVDGPLSASKSKLQSIMKTARGLFTSSAGVSAQAKMETLSPHSIRTRGQLKVLISGGERGSKLKPPPTEEKMPAQPQSVQEAQATAGESQSNVMTIVNEGRKTRSSAEKERKIAEVKENVHREQISLENDEDHPATTNVTQNAGIAKDAHANPSQSSRLEGQSPGYAPNEPDLKTLQASDNQYNNLSRSVSGIPQSRVSTSQAQRPRDLRRPAKPPKEAIAKAKPQPVSIRVGTMSQRIPLSNATISSGLQDSLPPASSKQPALTKKASAASTQTTTSSGVLKTVAGSNVSKPKALLAAERKKEQDERAAQRKLEQKREIERKRIAQQEESKRREQVQRQEADRQREKERTIAIEDSKKATQKQAIEKRRLEVERKEQLRQVSRQEQSHPLSTTNRQELGGSRPPSRLQPVHDHNRPPINQPPINPARPPVKRVFEPDSEPEPVRPVRLQGGQSYQQLDSKRRRTEDEEEEEFPIRPNMAPPIRQSNIRKDAPKQSLFTNGHSSSQAANVYHQSTSLLKTSTLNHTYQQHQPAVHVPRSGQPNEMAKYANGKIPFAETPNPPRKSPYRLKPAGPNGAKSSPQYANGDNIVLDEIPTDSEDEDSGDEKAKGAMLPEWAQSPNLHDLLHQQEMYADADVIFGPTRSPHLEEIFKSRDYRFRGRTSSANWNGQDRLTEEEILRDRAGRERLRREGGWTFGLG